VTKEDRIKYWLDSAKDDWKVAKHLFENGDYPYSLFFGHLTIEKILKAIYVDKLNESPPYTHRLVRLAEKISLGLTEEQLELLETITDFNMEARYPDEKFSFKKRCSRNFSKKYLRKIEDLKKWLTKRI
jgi:HEPN domain-containing protein